MTEETARGAPARDPESDKGVPEEGGRPREKWANKLEFLFAMTGNLSSPQHIGRFPYLFFVHGGVVFLIPYFLFLFFFGIPLFFLRTALGQYTSQSGVMAWRKIAPMFEGVGVASLLCVICANIYYIVLLVWAIFYLCNSFIQPLPWSTCDNEWNTESCVSRLSPYANPHLFGPDSNWSFLYNVTFTDYADNLPYMNDTYTPWMGVSSAQEYFSHRVLQGSNDVSLRKLSWELTLCLMAAWVICYFCIFKGTIITGKVVYVTVTLPFLILFMLFIRGVTLPGAAEGLKYFLMPDIRKLGDPQTWLDASRDVLFTYAVSPGVLTTLGSYNKYNNNCYRDCIGLCFLNIAISVFAGFVVFSLMGFLAHDLNISFEEVATSGVWITFVSIPKTLSLLPGSSFWSVLYFVMILLLTLNNQFLSVDSLATNLIDLFPRHLRRPGGREILVLVIAIVSFLLGLPFLTEGGMALFMLFDHFLYSDITVFLILCFETIVIAWVYGADRFCANIEDMIGYRPFPVLKYCWLFITPLICGILLLLQLSNRHIFTIYGYEYGVGSNILKVLLLITPLMCIPAFIFISLCRDSSKMTTPSSDLRQAQPHKPPLTLCGCVILTAPRQPNRVSEDGKNEPMMMDERSRI